MTRRDCEGGVEKKRASSASVQPSLHFRILKLYIEKFVAPSSSIRYMVPLGYNNSWRPLWRVRPFGAIILLGGGSMMNFCLCVE